MRVVSLSRFPVGVVRWRSPQPTLTVVVKATYTLGSPPSLAAEQLPLCGDEPGQLSSDHEIELPSDFAPMKPRADILLVGHAHGEAGTTMPIGFRIGGLRREGSVTAGRTMARIPLLSPFLKIDGAEPRLGPRALAPHGWDEREVTPTYDFTQFNVAPSAQQVGALASNSPIALDGLLPSNPRYEGQLPVMAPFVFVMALEDERQTGELVPMKCDTLWIHTDRELCTLTWRGTTPQVDESTYGLAVGTSAGPPPRWGSFFERLDVATWFEAEEEPPDVIVSEPPDRITQVPDSVTSVGLPVLEDDDEEPISSPPETPKRGVMLSQTGIGAALGGMVLASDQPQGESLPFEGSGPSSEPALGRPVDPDGAPALPFAQAPPTGSLRDAMAASAARDTQELSEDMVSELRTVMGIEAPPVGDELPFHGARKPAKTVNSAPLDAEVAKALEESGSRAAHTSSSEEKADPMPGGTMPPPPMPANMSSSAGAPFETAPPSNRIPRLISPAGLSPVIEGDLLRSHKPTLMGGMVSAGRMQHGRTQLGHDPQGHDPQGRVEEDGREDSAASFDPANLASPAAGAVLEDEPAPPTPRSQRPRLDSGPKRLRRRAMSDGDLDAVPDLMLPQLVTARVDSYDIEADALELRFGDRTVAATRDSSVHPFVLRSAAERGERVLVEKYGAMWLVVGALRTQPTPGEEDVDDDATLASEHETG